MLNAKTAGFRWLPSYYEGIRNLPDAERLRMYDAVMDFGFGNEVGELPPLLNAVFMVMAPTLERSVRFEQNQRENGLKGGRPKKQPGNPAQTQTEEDDNPEKTRDEACENPEETKSETSENLAVDLAADLAADHDKDVEKDFDKDADKDPGRKRGPRTARFTPPSEEEVRAYCQERRNSVNPQRFVDFYAAKGWRIGRESMKDWRAAVRTWEGRGTDGRDNGHGGEDQEIPGVLCL